MKTFDADLSLALIATEAKAVIGQAYRDLTAAIERIEHLTKEAP